MAPWLQSRMQGREIDLAVREGDGDPHSKETEKSSQLCGLNHITLEGNIHSIIALLHHSQSQTLAEKTITRECVPSQHQTLSRTFQRSFRRWGLVRL